MPLILYIITYVLVVATLTVPEVIAVTWPTISFIQSYEVTGIFLERLELFLLITWMLQFFNTFDLLLLRSRRHDENLQQFIYNEPYCFGSNRFSGQNP
ncbi:GerAB/ArcD/ProY family transporter [[Brevibacterium] frigoritolerans]|uniref:GerAB/ArcD/ProY family transporter n=1 Tax=Peribacillus frigoritolerans TaxID=450367 RepID=A0A941J927_9BACI|nr:GerAB/ArcD/ProY family transporter [Peribacillus frigoritolerans]